MNRQTITFLLLCSVSSFTVADVPYARCFQIASAQRGVPMDLLIGVAKVESAFNPDARSNMNAHGIMQVRWPVTARHLGITRVSELYNPCLNINVGASYLAELLKRYDGNETLAIAAYNYGPTRLRTEGDIPPRVRHYVAKVRKMRRQQAPVRQVRERLQLNAFQRQSLAERYVSSMQRFAPGARFLIHEQDNGYHVVLDTATLSRGDRLMLSRLLPGGRL